VRKRSKRLRLKHAEVGPRVRLDMSEDEGATAGQSAKQIAR